MDALIVYGDREGSFPAPFAHDTYFTNDRPGAIVIFPREGEPISIVAFPMAVADQMEARLRHEAVWIEPENVFAGKRGATLVELLKSCPRPRVLIFVQNPPPHKIAKYLIVQALTDCVLEQSCSRENRPRIILEVLSRLDSSGDVSRDYTFTFDLPTVLRRLLRRGLCRPYLNYQARL